jgi:hypothetical protein
MVNFIAIESSKIVIQDNLVLLLFLNLLSFFLRCYLLSNFFHIFTPKDITCKSDFLDDKELSKEAIISRIYQFTLDNTLIILKLY